MKTFKDFIRSSPIKEVNLYLYVETGEVETEAYVQAINEGKVHDIGKGWKVYHHQAHIPGAKEHLHFFVKGKELYSINQDGTGHDGSSGSRMHNKAVEFMHDKYPNFHIPKNKIIEQRILKTQGKTLIESYFISKEIVPKSVINDAIAYFGNLNSAPPSY